MTSYILCKTLVPWLCSRSQPGIKVIIRDFRGHLLHTVTFFFFGLICNSCFFLIFRGIDVVRNKIKMFAQQKVTLPRGRHKIIILDEADRYFSVVLYKLESF